MTNIEANLEQAKGKLDESLEKVGLSAEQATKKAQQKPKIDAIINKAKGKKEAAAEKFKLGQYGDA